MQQYRAAASDLQPSFIFDCVDRIFNNGHRPPYVEVNHDL